jgi:hypothetical protein
MKLKCNLIKYNKYQLTRLIISEKRLLDSGFDLDIDYSKGVTSEILRLISEGKNISKLV